MEDFSIWEKLVTGLGGIGLAVFAVWNRILAGKAKTANTSAEVAVSESSRTVFDMVTSRLSSVEAELTAVRQELLNVQGQLRERDNKIHFLEMHIVDLEHCLLQHGITPPPARQR